MSCMYHICYRNRGPSGRGTGPARNTIEPGTSRADARRRHHGMYGRSHVIASVPPGRPHHTYQG